jgi:hypothetical protein
MAATSPASANSSRSEKRARSACASRKPRNGYPGSGKVDIPQEAFIAALKVDV